MKTLAKWYMETVWTHIGSLRNLSFCHKLFNVAYSLRKAEYMAQIREIEPFYITQQKVRGAELRLMLHMGLAV